MVHILIPGPEVVKMEGASAEAGDGEPRDGEMFREVRPAGRFGQLFSAGFGAVFFGSLAAGLSFSGFGAASEGAAPVSAVFFLA